MVNSVVRPYFYDENGNEQATGERFWRRDYKYFSELGIKITYNASSQMKNLSVYVPTNSIIFQSDVKAVGNADMIQITINRTASRYWDYRNISVQGGFELVLEPPAETRDTVTFTLYSSDNPQPEVVFGFQGLTLDKVATSSCFYASTVEAQHCVAKYFKGDLAGTATRARYTVDGDDIASKVYLYRVAFKGQSTLHDTYGPEWVDYSTFGFSFIGTERIEFDDVEAIVEYLQDKKYYVDAWNGDKTTFANNFLEGWYTRGTGTGVFIPAGVTLLDFLWGFPAGEKTTMFKVTMAGQATIDSLNKKVSLEPIELLFAPDDLTLGSIQIETI